MGLLTGEPGDYLEPFKLQVNETTVDWKREYYKIKIERDDYLEAIRRCIRQAGMYFGWAYPDEAPMWYRNLCVSSLRKDESL